MTLSSAASASPENGSPVTPAPGAAPGSPAPPSSLGALAHTPSRKRARVSPTPQQRDHQPAAPAVTAFSADGASAEASAERLQTYLDAFVEAHGDAQPGAVPLSAPGSGTPSRGKRKSLAAPPLDWATLHGAVRAAARGGVLASAGVESMRAVTALVQQQLEEGAAADLAPAASEGREPSPEALAEARKTLECAALGMEVLNCAGVSRQLVEEGTVRGVCATVCNYAERALVPAAAAGRARLLPFVPGMLSSLMRQLHEFCLREAVQDADLLRLTRACLAVAGEPALAAVHPAAADALLAVFRRNPPHRAGIMRGVADLFEAQAAAGARRPARTVQVGEAGAGRVQTAVALLVQLLQCVCTADGAEAEAVRRRLVRENEAADALFAAGPHDRARRLEAVAAMGDAAGGGGGSADAGGGGAASAAGEDRALLLGAVRQYESSAELCRGFAGDLLQRLFGAAGGEDTERQASARAVAGAAVQDLIAMAHAPEWPAAEQVLLCLTLHFAQLVRTADAAIKVRLFAADELGAVCAELQTQRRLARDRPVVSAAPSGPVREDATPHDEAEDASCLCAGDAAGGKRAMFDCDECHKWFHFECVGLTEATLPRTWYCDSCRVRQSVAAVQDRAVRRRALRQVLEEVRAEQVAEAEAKEEAARGNKGKKKKGKKKKNKKMEGEGGKKEEPAPAASVDDTDPGEYDEATTAAVCMHLLVAYLDTVDTFCARTARQYCVARWLHAAHAAGEAAAGLAPAGLHVPDRTVEVSLGLWLPPSPERRRQPPSAAAVTPLTRHGSVRVARQLGQARPLARGFSRLFGVVLRAVSETQPRLRATAMRAFSSVVQADPSLLARDSVRQVVDRRCRDPSISVREATIDLVGTFMEHRPEVAAKYYRVLSDRLVDVGVSVRRKVIKIFRSLCLAPGSVAHPWYADICVRLLGRMGDEEAVQHLVAETMRQAWFGPASASASRGAAPDAFSDEFLLLVDAVVRVTAAMHPDTGPLVDLLRRELAGGGAGASRSFGVCADMCTAVVEAMLDGGGGSEDDAPSAVDRMRALHAFCQASPLLLAPHAATLQPFVKVSRDATPEELGVCALAVDVLLEALPLVDTPLESFVDTVQRDLVALIRGRTRLPLLKKAVACLCAVVERVSGRHDLLEGMLRPWHGVLVAAACKGEARAEALDPRRRDTLSRCLLIVGLFQRHFDFDRHNERRAAAAAAEGDGAGPPPAPFSLESLAARGGGRAARVRGAAPVVAACFEAFQAFCGSPDLALRRCALQALVYACSRAPSLLAAGHRELSDALSGDSDAARLTVLNGLREFLQNEDSLLQTLQREQYFETQRRAMRGGGGGGGGGNDDHHGSASSAHDSCLRRRADGGGDGYVGGTMRNFLPQLLPVFRSPSGESRAAALATVGWMLRHGYLNPQQCAAPLVSLLADPNAATAAQALVEARVLLSKYRSSMLSRAADGVAGGLEVLRAAAAPLDTRAAAASPAGRRAYGMAALYELLRGSRDACLALCGQLAARATAPEASQQEVEYLCTVLAALPYAHDEPLHVLRALERAIVEEGSALEERAAAGEEPPRAAAVSVMCALKAHLKAAYDLTQKRCDEFDPHAPKRDAQKLARRDDAAFELGKDGGVAGFRAAMEAHTTDLEVSYRRKKRRAAAAAAKKRGAPGGGGGAAPSSSSSASSSNKRQRRRRRPKDEDEDYVA